MSVGMVLAASIKAVGVRYASRSLVETCRPSQPDPSQCVEIPGRIAWQGLKGTRDLLTKVLAMCGAANLIDHGASLIRESRIRCWLLRMAANHQPQDPWQEDPAVKEMWDAPHE